MIISCPHCSSRYKVKDDLISTSGKKLRCKKCSAVFTAFPDKDAVLVKLPDGTPVKAAAKPKPAAPAAPTAGATIQVDRSQIDAFLKNQDSSAPPAPAAPKPPPGPAIDTSGTVRVDRSQIDAFLKQSEDNPPAPPPAPAPSQPMPDMAGTVQVDRSQIDAFLKQAEDEKQEEALAQPPSNDMAGTVQVDRSQIDAFLKQGPPEEEEPPQDVAGTVKVDRSQLDQFLQSPQPGAAADTDATVSHPQDSNDDTAQIQKDEEIDFNIPSSNDEPEFPSDEELGIEMKDNVDLLAPTAEIPVADPNYKRTSQSSETAASVNPTPPPPPEPAKTTVGKLYKAKVEVDGEVYPDLPLESIRRWVEENRLIETDLVAEQNSEHFKPAGQYPEFKPFFKIQSQAEAESAAAPKKKGFFAWLKGLFKKS